MRAIKLQPVFAVKEQKASTFIGNENCKEISHDIADLLIQSAASAFQGFDIQYNGVGLKRASERGKGKSCVQPDTICYPESVTPSRRTAACQFIATLHLTAETQIAGGSALTFSSTVNMAEYYGGVLL